ncbi:membrane-bound lytic murein transglycosylase D [Desulfovibrio legallii]|uniref:Membrane-bound lytic murein transglycosylase D n=1 Tax=Desulfovibrio legallii TaxID=571438 RepID=A0A1G7N1F8_9BACT|nr:membrane-bound lytic murein transglycosylase D [Desulfovibrio legallii]
MDRLGSRQQPATVRGLFLLVCCCLVLAGGCASRQGAGDKGNMPSLLVPEDNSPPLSNAELAALKSAGHVDKDIPQAAMPDVARQYKYFLRQGRPTMQVFSKRAEHYLAYARKVFRSRGMPEDLAYLAIVESGYRPDAKSPAGAAGAWQFMPSTGRQYGLTQDWWTDERLDPYQSTEAAADYLQKLYGEFGDWPTAIAAYNAGEGKMGRAMQGTGGKDFFEVRARNHMLDDKARLREETKQYVPRFMAVTKIMRNLPQLGFTPVNPETAPEVRRFTARPGTDLMALAKACRLDWEDFRSYNPHHKRPISDTSRSTFVYLPAMREGEATAFLRSPQCAPYAGWTVARVGSSADSWSKISRRCGVPEARLRALNPGNGSLRAGETVLVPRSADMSARAVAALDARPAPGKKGKAPSAVARAGQGQGKDARHTLRADETLYAVARRYGVSVQDLQEYNGIANPNRIHAGAELRIPGRGGSAPRTVANKNADGGRRVYTVQSNDNLWKIARAHNVSVEDLQRWNKVDPKSLRAGATLVVRQ